MAKLNFSKDNILNCIIFCAIGLLLIIFKSHLIEIMLTVVGVTLIVFGIINLVKKNDTTVSVLQIIIGAVIVVLGWIIVEVVLVVCGVTLAVWSLYVLIKKPKSGFLSYFCPIVVLIIGIALIVAAWLFVDYVLIGIGVLSVINGILILFDKRLI